MRYTDAQQQAIQSVEPNLQIIACAGSGKTQVLAERTAHLLALPEVSPRNILAFTFTEKAAAELNSRIIKSTESLLGPMDGMAEMYVGTIHGFCLDFLQTYLYEFLKYNVLSQVQTELLSARNSSKCGLSGVEVYDKDGNQTFDEEGNVRTLSRRTYDVRVFLEALNVLREDHVDLSRVPEPLREALDAYTELLDEHRYLDYSRIQKEAVDALRDPDDESRLHAQQLIAERIKYVIVDEYQDVNPLQEDLVRRLYELGANVCVVGDDDQTIYQWRGSEVRNIITFTERYEDVVSVKMGENFRSSLGVVETARRIAERNEERLDKPVSAAGHQPFDYGDLLALRFDNPTSEAEWIADKIVDLRGTPFQDKRDGAHRGLDWSDFAILLRTIKDRTAGPLAEALRARDIPFIVGGFTSLFEAEEIKAAEGLFRYVVRDIYEPGDDEEVIDETALRELWRAARVGMTDDDFARGIDVLDRARDWDANPRWAAYNIQRTFLNFLEAVRLREERIPPTASDDARADIVYCNLGKFSQVISDFEQIHFQSEPAEKYLTFVKWLKFAAPDYYDEGMDTDAFARPNAVQISTIHQAKGREWPAVFAPALQKDHFPSRGPFGRTKWHLMPSDAVENASRYDGSTEDERRLLYVAITRSKKYFFGSFAPEPDKKRWYQKPSPFFKELTDSPRVLTTEPRRRAGEKLEPHALDEVPAVVLSFSELRYFYMCPYQFKLRFLYGFNPPIHEALGFGKSLHDALAEIHKRAEDGEHIDRAEVDDLVARHFHIPFAYPDLRDELQDAAVEAVDRYLVRNDDVLDQVVHTEKQVEIHVDPEITVNGRIDLIKRLDTGEVS
ncbi:MAG: ATP-dependent helicase, partial [Persicimonas sp.]